MQAPPFPGLPLPAARSLLLRMLLPLRVLLLPLCRALQRGLPVLPAPVLPPLQMLLLLPVPPPPQMLLLLPVLPPPQMPVLPPPQIPLLLPVLPYLPHPAPALWVRLYPVLRKPPAWRTMPAWKMMPVWKTMPAWRTTPLYCFPQPSWSSRHLPISWSLPQCSPLPSWSPRPSRSQTAPPASLKRLLPLSP